MYLLIFTRKTESLSPHMCGGIKVWIKAGFPNGICEVDLELFGILSRPNPNFNSDVITNR